MMSLASETIILLTSSNLEDLSDSNVQIFVRLIRSVEDSVNSIMSVNNITNPEIEQPRNS
jgi:hypothetical protein